MVAVATKAAKKSTKKAGKKKGEIDFLSPEFAKMCGVPGSDTGSVLKAIEAQENEAFAKFQAEQKAKREAALAALIEPLRTARNKAAQQVNDLNQEIKLFDAQIAKLTGVKAPEASGRKRAKRKSAEEKLQIATILHGVLKDNAGKRYSSGDLDAQSQGVPVRELVAVWNEANKSDKIGTEGNKASTRYFWEK